MPSVSSVLRSLETALVVSLRRFRGFDSALGGGEEGGVEVGSIPQDDGSTDDDRLLDEDGDTTLK